MLINIFKMIPHEDPSANEHASYPSFFIFIILSQSYTFKCLAEVAPEFERFCEVTNY